MTGCSLEDGCIQWQPHFPCHFSHYLSRISVFQLSSNLINLPWCYLRRDSFLGAQLFCLVPGDLISVCLQAQLAEVGWVTLLYVSSATVVFTGFCVIQQLVFVLRGQTAYEYNKVRGKAVLWWQLIRICTFLYFSVTVMIMFMNLCTAFKWGSSSSSSSTAIVNPVQDKGLSWLSPPFSICHVTLLHPAPAHPLILSPLGPLSSLTYMPLPVIILVTLFDRTSQSQKQILIHKTPSNIFSMNLDGKISCQQYRLVT